MGVNRRIRFGLLAGTLAGMLLVITSALAKDKKLPSGEASNDAVLMAASVLDSESLMQIFNSDFKGIYSVIEVTLRPQPGRPLEIHLDDFLLRSEQTGDHTGPLLAAQIAGQGSLMVRRAEPPRPKFGMGGGIGGVMMGGGAMGAPTAVDNSKVQVKEDAEQDPMLNILKRKILAEKTVSEPVTGLLFFPLDKEKPKHLAMIYTTPAGKIRLQFR